MGLGARTPFPVRRSLVRQRPPDIRQVKSRQAARESQSGAFPMLTMRKAPGNKPSVFEAASGFAIRRGATGSARFHSGPTRPHSRARYSPQRRTSARTRRKRSYPGTDSDPISSAPSRWPRCSFSVRRRCAEGRAHLGAKHQGVTPLDFPLLADEYSAPDVVACSACARPRPSNRAGRKADWPARRRSARACHC
jgi:hypothetical protein